MDVKFIITSKAIINKKIFQSKEIKMFLLLNLSLCFCTLHFINVLLNVVII